MSHTNDGYLPLPGGRRYAFEMTLEWPDGSGKVYVYPQEPTPDVGEPWEYRCVGPDGERIYFVLDLAVGRNGDGLVVGTGRMWSSFESWADLIELLRAEGRALPPPRRPRPERKRD